VRASRCASQGRGVALAGRIPNEIDAKRVGRLLHAEKPLDVSKLILAATYQTSDALDRLEALKASGDTGDAGT
jgi:hypothetical protein